MNQAGLHSEQDVIIPRTRDNLGRPVYKAQLTPADDQRDKVLLVKQLAPIPVIFIPGIMGTNLRNKKTKARVWRPPNAGGFSGVLEALGAVLVWVFRGPKRRQELLKAEDVEVDDLGAIDLGASGLSEEAARSRGWGKVHCMGYGPFMALMETRLDSIVSQQEIQGWWGEESQRSPAEYGEELGKVDALDEKQLLQAGKYQFDIWCAGYNWLQSNRQSAQDVRDYIENTVLSFYRQRGGISSEQAEQMKVILVTHSMGGLVSRTLTQVQGYQRVLGVVHGVQPAVGSSAIYHHMRCGYEGAVRLILGANAGEVTSVVGNSPGALELLPTAEYRQGKPWLFLCDAQGQVIRDVDESRRAYPQNKDPYGEIYKSSAWYGLVPEQNSKYLDISSELDKQNSILSPRAMFNKLIDVVEEFHIELSTAGYHSETYAHYAADNSPERHSWRDIIWQGEPGPLERPGSTFKDDERGSYNSWFRRGLPYIVPTLGSWSEQGDEASGSGGDGTVPTDSGQTPGQNNIRASFRHGNKGRGSYNSEQGYEHADSYNDKRAQWAAFYGVIKIAQLANWHSGDQGCS
ncbi:esterase/lipase family protein [Pseudomonas protegens]|uniref:esterase/lipase family protein n=1 Tax=Pseudomonas protegens TaxID=380021 RepID=UPI003905CAE2